MAPTATTPTMAMTTTAAMEAIARRETPGLAGAATDALWAAGILSCAVALGVDRRGRLLGFGRKGLLGRKAVGFHSGSSLGCGRRTLGLAALPLLALSLGALLPGLLAAALLLLALAAAGVARLLLGRKVGPGIGCGILVPGCLIRRESRLILALLARKLRVGRGGTCAARSASEVARLGLARPRLRGARSPGAARRASAPSWSEALRAARGAMGTKGRAPAESGLLKRLGRGNGLAGGRVRRGIGTHRRTALLAEARLVRDFCPTVVALHSGPPAPSCQLLPIILETPRRAKFSRRRRTAKPVFINIYQPKLLTTQKGRKAEAPRPS